MASRYIHELEAWPHFRWDLDRVGQRLAEVRHWQGRLIGRMAALGFGLRAEATLRSLTEEVLRSNEIEGQMLDQEQVRSSLARRLGMEIGVLRAPDRHVEGVVEMLLDATQRFAAPLTVQRLFDWQAALFPTGRSGMTPIRVGAWRDDGKGPMQVVSGPFGRETVHFEAPAADRLESEMFVFLKWFNQGPLLDGVLKAAIGHLWFVTIHPFDDGNGRVARALTDLLLARSEGSPQRFYSMSSQIVKERNGYYQILESTQKGDLEITNWLLWFFDCLEGAFAGMETLLALVLRKAEFWKRFETESFNDRQRKVLNRFLDGFEGKLTSSKWATLAKCSQDTATRDLNDLLHRGVLKKGPAGGRSSSYQLIEDGD